MIFVCGKPAHLSVPSYIVLCISIAGHRTWKWRAKRFSDDSFRLQSLKWEKLGPRKRSGGHVWWVGSENHLIIPWKRYLKCLTTLKGLSQSVMFQKPRLVGCFRAIFKGNFASFSENDFTSWVYYMNLLTCFLCSFVCISFLKLSFCFNNDLELCADFQAWRSEDDAR